jgi:phosphocarrier protein FPr
VQVTLKAPLSGVVVPIESVPDPVFSQKIVGDGIAIDPVTSILRSPCDGTIVQMHASNHAVTVATAEGLEVLLHIGLDTVKLGGRGFTPRVQQGASVKTGDPLIEFDADFVAMRAPSLVTVMLIANSDTVATWNKAQGLVNANEHAVLELHTRMPPRTAENGGSHGTSHTSEPIVIPNPAGLHARPSAVLANAARRYRAEINLLKADKVANAKSVISMLNLSVGHGDTVRLQASGPDAETALQALAPMLRDGLGETHAPSEREPPRTAAQPSRRSEDPNALVGATASPGLVAGRIFQLRRGEIEVAEYGDTVAAEQDKLRAALDAARRELDTLQGQLGEGPGASKAEIFAAHRELLEDPELSTAAAERIGAGKSAAFAWKTTVDEQAGILANLQNEMLAARANDLHDVGRRVLEKLSGTKVSAVTAPPDSILIAEDLTPSDTATLDRSRVLGFATTLGGATSHVAILARSLDIPAIAGIEARALEIPTGTPAILDGSHGTLHLHPSADEMSRVERLLADQRTKREREHASAHRPAITRDGHRLEVVANIAGLADAEQAVALGGEGVGLLRTEFLFVDRTTAPSEDEQTETYLSIVRALGPTRPLIIRTLDVGGDKPLPYVPLPPEDNPFLGERGIRIGLNRRELLATQLRAILRAGNEGKVLVMFPMISTVDELRTAREMVEHERQRLDVKPIPIGIMVEVPAVAVMAEQFARDADFFSIGTNDLTQYTLAMDRGHPKLAPQIDGLNPAVLRLIDLAVRGARQHGKWVGVCGGIAGDPQAVPLLAGLGVTELSVSVPAIAAVKAQLRGLRLTDCEALAKRALGLDTAAQVRSLVDEGTEATC